MAPIPRGGAALKDKAHSNVDVAIDRASGKILHRWEKGNASHWIVGSYRTFEGKDYVLKEIIVGALTNWLVCEPA